MQRGIRLSILGISLVALISSGVIIWQCYQQDLLWGHWPLIFFTAFWLVMALLRLPKAIKKNPKHLRWLSLSGLSGLLLSIGFPPLPFAFLMFLGFVPLLIVEREIADGTPGHTNKTKVFRYAYNAFLVWNILTTFWVANTAFVAGILAIVTNTFLMCIPFVLYHLSRKVLNEKLQGAAIIVYWITFEYLHMYWQLSWPWLTLGNSLSEFPSLVQWYEYTGAFGGSLWILLTNVLLFTAYRKGHLSKANLKAGNFAQIIALLLLPCLISLGIFYTYEEKGTPVEVVIIQPNYEPHYEKFDLPVSSQLNRFIRLSDSLVTDKTRYLLFPETSFNRIDTNQIMGNMAMRKLKTFVNQHPDLKLVTGISSYKIYRKGEPHSHATRKSVQSNGNVFYWESYNSAFQLTSGEDQIEIYLKSLLVPGAEIFPYKNQLFFLKPVVEALDGAVILGSQPKREAFPSTDGRVGPIICYESIYGEYVTGYIRQGANALFISTNDGWWDNTAGHKQHNQFAILRAIETRRPIARSANTGISCFIDQRGIVHQATPYQATTGIRSEILFNDTITFYVIWGDLIARIALFTSILFLLNTFVKSLTGKKDNEKAPIA